MLFSNINFILEHLLCDSYDFIDIFFAVQLCAAPEDAVCITAFAAAAAAELESAEDAFSFESREQLVGVRACHSEFVPELALEAALHADLLELVSHVVSLG